MRDWMKRHRRLLIIAVVLTGIAAGVPTAVFCMRGKVETKQRQVRQNTLPLSKMDLTRSVSATGTIESAKVKIVRADVSDIKIEKVLVNVGDKVKKGQTLVTFDKSDLQQTLQEAEDNLSDVKEQNQTELSAAQRKLTEARKTYENQKKEQKQGASPVQGESDVQSAKDALATTKNTQKKTLKEAQKSVREAKKALEDCSATASMDGTVTAIGVEPGDSYHGGDLAEISDCSNFQVKATVDEYEISELSKGQKVIILTDATGDTELQGKITYVAPTTGSTLNNSGSSDNSGSSGNGGSSSAGSTSSSSSGYEVRIRVKTSSEKLRVGMTARCSMILEEVSDVYAVPYDAIHTNRKGETVLYVQDSSGKQSEVAVTKGMESDYYTEVSGEQLSEGLQILLPTDKTNADVNSGEKEDNRDGGLDGFLNGSRENRGERNRPNQRPDGAPNGMAGM